MSANRCLMAWYDASGRPNELRSARYSSVNSNDAVERADGLRALQHDGELQLPFDRGRGGVDVADEPCGRYPNAVEAHGGEAPHEVDRVERLDRDAGRARRDQELREPARASPRAR